MAYRKQRCRLITRSYQVAGFISRPVSNPTGARRQPKQPKGETRRKAG